MSPVRVSSALFLQYRLPLGCLVHATPVFEAVRRSRPDLRIAIATRGLGLNVLRNSPYVDSLIEAPDPTENLWAAVKGLRFALREARLRPDCVLTGASDQRTRIALMALFGTSGWRGGYTLAPRLYRHPLRYDPNVSLIENNLRLANLLGCDTQITRPRVFFSAEDVQHAEGLLRVANPDGRSVAVLVTQSSGGQRTGWHSERFVQVIRHIAQRGFAVAYVGTAGEGKAIDQIRAEAGTGISFAGQTTVNQLAAVLAMSDGMVTLDTGTMHVGRGVGVPMVVLGPSWQRPIEWLPLGLENVVILRGEDRDDVPQDYRLDEISAESAVAAFDGLMRIYSPSATKREARIQENLSTIDHVRPR